MTVLFEPSYLDTGLRLLLAVLGGSLIGLNRFLRHKSAGMRTHGLVALGAAMATLMAAHIGDAEVALAVDDVKAGFLEQIGHRRRVARRIGQPRHLLILGHADDERDSLFRRRRARGNAE